MYPERYLFLKGNLTGERHICNFIDELVARGPTGLIFLAAVTARLVWRFGDVQQIAEYLQRDSFYLLVSIIAMQTFCTNMSCVSSYLLQCSVLLTDT
jgi:hypothetical protein